MTRKSTLTVSLVFIAITVIVIAFAVKRLAYLYSFDTPQPSRAAESAANAGNQSGLGEVTLTWDPAPGVKTYNLYWSTTPGVTRHSGNKIAGVAPPYTFKEVQKGRTYYFVVTSVTDAGESGESNEIVFKADK
jgi:hypothetical protein